MPAVATRGGFKQRPFRITEKPDYDLAHVSAAERLWLWRVRQQGPRFGRAGGGISRTEAARRLGIKPRAYEALETGRVTALSAEVMARLGPVLGDVVLTLREQLVLARRRYGEDLQNAAEGIGLTSTRYLQLEEQADPRVVNLWEDRGFRFAPKEKSS